MSDNIIVRKSENFAVRVVNLFRHQQSKKDEYVMSKQLLRCGTSIGANIAEAQEAQSDSDFIAKLFISLKETSETNYWLKLLYRTNYLNKEEYDSIHSDSCELKALLTSIIKSKKSNMGKSA